MRTSKIKIMAPLFMSFFALNGCGQVEATKLKPKPIDDKPPHRLEAKTLCKNGAILESEPFQVTSRNRDARTARLRFEFHFATAPAIDQVWVTLELDGGSLEPIPGRFFEVQRVGSNDLDLVGLGRFSGVWDGERLLINLKARAGLSFGGYEIPQGTILLIKTVSTS